MITALPRIAIAMHDYEGAVATFREVFGLPVFDFSDRTVPALGAHVGMCQPEGGSNIELMAPANPSEPLSQALQKFLDRRGDGLYALMLEAPDPDAEADELAGRGLDVLPLMPGASGRDIHPRSTHGILVRVYPDGSVADQGGPAAAPGLSGIVRVIVATGDASLAAAAYGHGFGLDVGEVTRDGDRGVDTVTCRPPRGGDIELVSAADTDRPFARAIGEFVKEHHAGMYALVLQADDPGAAASVLSDRGVAVVDGPLGTEALVYGTRFILERRPA